MFDSEIPFPAVRLVTIPVIFPPSPERYDAVTKPTVMFGVPANPSAVAAPVENPAFTA